MIGAPLTLQIGDAITDFQVRGNTDAAFGTECWRKLARALCAAEYEVLERMLERDEGKYDGRPVHPLLVVAEPIINSAAPVSLNLLFDDYIASRKILGRGAGSEKRWTPVIRSLVEHLGHDDARRLVKRDLIAWRDHLLQSLAPKTVRDVYLAVTSRKVIWLFSEQLRLHFVPVLHRLQGCLAAEG